MGLKEELDAFRTEFVRKTPPGRAELYDAKPDALLGPGSRQSHATSGSMPRITARKSIHIFQML